MELATDPSLLNILGSAPVCGEKWVEHGCIVESIKKNNLVYVLYSLDNYEFYILY